jgi:hypothetical protein
VKVVHFKGGGARVQVNLDRVGRDDSRPEEAILPDSRVEIVDLYAP